MPHIGVVWLLRESGPSACVSNVLIEKNFQGALAANPHGIYLKAKNGKLSLIR
jgi:hypothetical protein